MSKTKNMSKNEEVRMVCNFKSNWGNEDVGMCTNVEHLNSDSLSSSFFACDLIDCIAANFKGLPNF